MKKDPGGTTSVALVYPNTYKVGMSNLAVHSLYKIFNDHPNFSCERAFLPEKKDWVEHERTDTPILTVETQKQISEFDIVAFTISFENDLLNVVPILKLCKIPLKPQDRGPDHPSIIAGGAAVTLNPKPMSGIANACILGEFEAYDPEGLLRGGTSAASDSSKVSPGTTPKNPTSQESLVSLVTPPRCKTISDNTMSCATQGYALLGHCD